MKQHVTNQGGRHQLLPSTPPRQIRRRVGSEVTIRLVLDHVLDRLLQLSTGRPAADNDRTTAASAERSRSPSVRT